MSPKQSAYGKLGIPNTIGVTVTLLMLALALSPYMADKDLGFLKVPAFSQSAAHTLKLLGPVLLAASLLLFFPYWETRIGSPRSASSYVATDVVFRNSSTRYIYIVWLKFDGKEDPEHSYTLVPGAVQTIATYVAHTWNISDANTGDVLRCVVVKKGMDPVVVR
jgi:hypothetical protein